MRGIAARCPPRKLALQRSVSVEDVGPDHRKPMDTQVGGTCGDNS